MTPASSVNPNPRDLDHDLSNLSSSLERLKALRQLQFKDDEIGLAVGVGDETVRKWLKEERHLSRRNQEALDNFRAIVEILYRGLVLDQKKDVESVHSFFMNQPEWGAPAPIGFVYSDPGAVGAAAEAQIAGDRRTLANLMKGAFGPSDLPEPVALPEEPELPEQVGEKHVQKRLDRRATPKSLPKRGRSAA